jgi:SAM-dependent methyltransferase
MTFVDRFSERAQAYVAARPSYPLEAITAIVEGMAPVDSLRIVDVGAGTGISSRLLADFGPHVIAVEPNAPMRAAAQPHPKVTWVDGIAERTSLPDASVDVITAFQAWHWVDHPAGILEARRILRPNGRIAIVYNERDEDDEFTAAYGEIVRRFAQDDTEARRANARAAFASVDPARTVSFHFRNVQALTREGVHQRASSSSYLPQNGEDATALHIAIDDLLDEFPTDRYEMRLVTIVERLDVP